MTIGMAILTGLWLGLVPLLSYHWWQLLHPPVLSIDYDNTATLQFMQQYLPANGTAWQTWYSSHPAYIFTRVPHRPGTGRYIAHDKTASGVAAIASDGTVLAPEICAVGPDGKVTCLKPGGHQ